MKINFYSLIFQNSISNFYKIIQEALYNTDHKFSSVTTRIFSQKQQFLYIKKHTPKSPHNHFKIKTTVTIFYQTLVHFVQLFKYIYTNQSKIYTAKFFFCIYTHL